MNEKIFRFLMAIIFCVAATLLIIFAVDQNSVHRVDEWVIIPAIIGATEPFIAVLLVIKDRFYENTFVRWFAVLFDSLNLIAGIILTLFSIPLTIIGNDFEDQWSLPAIAIGVLGIVHLVSFVVIIMRIYQGSKDKRENTNY
jgi:hypothetical protein